MYKKFQSNAKSYKKHTNLTIYTYIYHHFVIIQNTQIQEQGL